MKTATKRWLLALTVIFSSLCIAFGVAACAGSGCVSESSDGKSLVLVAPVIRLDKEKGVISWNAVPNAEYYLVYEDDFTTPIDTVTETSYKISEIKAGVHEFAVAAYNKKARPAMGPLSDKEKYTVHGSVVSEGGITDDNADNLDNKTNPTDIPSGNKLAVPTVTAVGNALNWLSVANATDYNIYRDNFNEPIATVGDTTYTMTELGEYKVQAIQIIPEGEKGSTEYAPGSLSDGTHYTVSGKLYTDDSVDLYNGNDDRLTDKNNYITVELDDRVELNKKYTLVIQLNNNYSLSYISDICVSGSYSTNPDDFLSSQLVKTTFTVDVKITEHTIVIGIFGDLIQSDNKVVGFNVYLQEAPTEECTRTKLTAPTATLRGNAINWSAVDNATAYKVYKDGGLYETLISKNEGVLPTSYTVTEAGSYTVTALGDADKYLESAECSTVEYTLGSSVLCIGGSIDIVASACAQIALDSGVELGKKYFVTITVNNDGTLSNGIINIIFNGSASETVEPYFVTATKTESAFVGSVRISDRLILEITNTYEASIGLNIALSRPVRDKTQIEWGSIGIGNLSENTFGTPIDVSELAVGDYTITLTNTDPTVEYRLSTGADYNESNDPKLDIKNAYQFYPVPITAGLDYIYLYAAEGSQTKISVKLEEGDHTEASLGYDMNDGRLWVDGPEITVTIVVDGSDDYIFIDLGDNVTDGIYNLSVKLNKSGELKVYNGLADSGILFKKVGSFETKEYTVDTSYGMEIGIFGSGIYTVVLKLESIINQR